MKRIPSITLTVLTTLGVLLLLWQFRLAVVLFLFSLVVAAVVRPVVESWAERGVPQGLAILTIYLLGIGSLVGVFLLISRPLFSELSQASNDFVNAYVQMALTWPDGSPFQQAVVAQLPPPNDLFEAMAGEQGMRLAQSILGVAQGLFGLLSQLFIILALSIYWTSGRARFERLWFSILPARTRTRALEIWRAIEVGVSAYVRSELVQSVLAAFLLGLGYWYIGVRYPVLLAFAGALLWLVPWLGAVLAVVLAALTGLLGSTTVAASAATYTLIVLFIMEVVVEPRLFDRKRYSSLLIAIVLVAMADVFGIVGLILAPPLAAALQIFFRHLMAVPSVPEVSLAGSQLATLQSRMDKLKDAVSVMETPPPPEMINLMQRLDKVLDESCRTLE